MSKDFFNARDTLRVSTGSYSIYRLDKLEKDGLTRIDLLPFSIRTLLESLLRQCNESEVTRRDVQNLASWKPKGERAAMPYIPARVVMQDFSGVPAVVDLAAMRSAVARMGGDPAKVNPVVPVDLIVDHSVQVDFHLGPDALVRNADLEFQRNRERYEFLRWGQKAFNNFRVVPPATGIIHQINLEYLAPVVMTNSDGEAFPDTLVGTDSHTPMVNALGVVGWGVGGIEAEAAMLGQPIDMLTPDVIGMKLTGRIAEGVTATDVVLTVTQVLRKRGVVDKFVEFFGPGVAGLSLTDRAVIANMAPEYGATMGFFPVDDETIRYLKMTGRPTELVEAYCKAQRLYRLPESPDPEYTDVVEFDLGSVVPSLAGPKRPQDRVPLADMKPSFRKALAAPPKDRGFELKEADLNKSVAVGANGSAAEMKHGAVVIAAITACTNTSNPSVMIGAALLAKKALEKGLKVKSYVKTSLAPGSRVVTEYLEKAGLLEPLAQLGFNVVGYGCTTCIGNSGPLAGEVARAITGSDLIAAAVISGNRNFEGRVHALVKANYLASPPLVVSYALAGTVDFDLINDPLGEDEKGVPVYLRDLWPSNEEIRRVVAENVRPEMFQDKYADVFTGSDAWRAIQIGEGQLFEWDANSTYIQEPPFFQNLQEVQPIGDILGARVLALFGDSITTDHISPAGSIATDSPAGKYLMAKGVQPSDFNSYGARRGNDQVLTRGTFANIRIKNRLTPGIEGGVTIYQGGQESASGDQALPIYDAAVKYQQSDVPTIILAGKEYGTGSSRDWAAKGPNLLGVKAVIAESYERIHRSNLVGMGVLPLQFRPGQNAETLGLTGHEVFDITGLSDRMPPQGDVTVTAAKDDGSVVRFTAVARLNTAVEVDYYRNGGVLNAVLRKMMA